MFRLFQQDFKLLDIVENRRVVLVGPAPYLEDKKLGSIIDSYDIVCRINNISVSKELKKDYGYRTDIVFDSCDYRNYDNVALSLKNNEDLIKNVKLFFIPGQFKADHKGELNVFDIFKKTYMDNGYNVPYGWVGEQNYNILEQAVGCEPTTGMNVINILLLHDVKELFITGFTFFKDKVKNSSQYHHKGYYQLKNSCTEPFNPNECHNIEKIVNFFKNDIMAEHKEIIKIDSYINSLLHLHHDNVEYGI